MQRTTDREALTDISTAQPPHLRLGDISEEEAERLLEKQGVCCEVVAPRNDWRTTPMIPQWCGCPNKI